MKVEALHSAKTFLPLYQTARPHILGRVVHHSIQKGTRLPFCMMSLIPHVNPLALEMDI